MGRAQGPTAARRTRRLTPNLDTPLGSDTEFSGALLRRLRESAEATIDDVADITKINKRYLRAVEEHDYAALPAAVYVRGFVCEYARALGLEAEVVAKSYMTIYQRYKGEGV
ncbi:MAG: helix-turn-helix domain-containing protein [Deltaproteobacteria bacterium]|nr:helix-turn-helix domain-containing protein [Deltaproteobacteria bacterium]